MDGHQSIWSMLAAAARRLVRRGTRPDMSAQRGPSARGHLSDWSDAELYKVWCATTAELLKALEAEHADNTVTAAKARQHLLAEIERRRPRATAAWLASDAILSGEPPTFLLRDTSG